MPQCAQAETTLTQSVSECGNAGVPGNDQVECGTDRMPECATLPQLVCGDVGTMPKCAQTQSNG